MARRTIKLDIPTDPATAFAFLEDFTNVASWDPGVDSIEQVTDGPVTVGTRYAVDLLIAGKVQRWTYVCEQHDAPNRAMFATRTKRATGIDDVTVLARDGGSTVIWDATFSFNGPLGKLIDPFFQPVFSRIVDKAVGGLEAALIALPVA